MDDLNEIATCALQGNTFEHMRVASEAIAEMNQRLSALRRFIQRVERGDPRLCKAGMENPRYFEKFGYAE